jgi:hypothetical protein
MYASVASSNVIKACFVQSLGCLSQNSSAKIPELSILGCLISWAVRTTDLIDHGGFRLREAMNWSRRSRSTTTLSSTVDWWPLTQKWIYSHPTACCDFFMQLPVLLTIVKCASRVKCLVGALGASRWTHWCLRFCCVPIGDVFDEVPANRQDLDPLGPGWDGGVSMIYWCGIGEEDDNERKWEVLRIILLGTCQNGIISCHDACYTQDESCCT